MLLAHRTGIQRWKPKTKLSDHLVIQVKMDEQVRQNSGDHDSVMVDPWPLPWDTLAPTFLIFKDWTEFNFRN